MAGRVLIVDDEDNVGRMLRRSLEAIDIAAVNCDIPEVALELLKEEPFPISVDEAAPAWTVVTNMPGPLN